MGVAAQAPALIPPLALRVCRLQPVRQRPQVLELEPFPERGRGAAWWQSAVGQRRPMPQNPEWASLLKEPASASMEWAKQQSPEQLRV